MSLLHFETRLGNYTLVRVEGFDKCQPDYVLKSDNFFNLLVS